MKRYDRSRATTAHALCMLVDALENRTLLSTLPAPITTANTSIAGLATNGMTNYSSPSVAYNPLNPLEVVEASVEDAPSTPGDQKVLIQLSYSTNGGTTWANVAVPGNLEDPVASTPQLTHVYTAATDPTVAFDRNGDFYLCYSENTGNTQGEIVLQQYDFTTNTPTLLSKNNKVYVWTSISAQYGAALHPTMAVDDNVPSYTAGGVTLTDATLANGAVPVYVAWATNWIPSPLPDNWNPNAILMSQSSDGGQTFSDPIYLNNGQNIGAQRDTYPKLTISQGTLATTGLGAPVVEPGQVTAVWDDFGTGANAGPPFDDIDTNHTITTAAAPALEVGAQVVDPNDRIPIADATGTSPNFVPSVTDIPFTLNVPAGFTLSTMQLELGLTGPDLSEFEVDLIAPDGTDLELIANGKDNTGTATGNPAPGAKGSYLGVIQSNGQIFGTVFSDNGQLSIDSTTAASPYPGSYTPSGGGSFLGTFAGAQLNGTWTLEITDNVADTNATVAQQVNDFKISLGSLQVANSTDFASTYVTGSLNGPFNAPGDYPSSPTLGVGPAAVIASDNTLGDYSQHQGRIYVAYVTKASNATSNTDIALTYSDDGGVTWGGGSTKVNDDVDTIDGYSGSSNAVGDRSQFEPSVAVDQANGTLVLTWYDARYDAADARVARFITTSLDGGKTFGSQTYLNEPNQVYNAISGQATNLGPIPDNFSGAAQGLIGEGQFGYGTQQGLTVYDGHVYATWTGNENQGPEGNMRLGILTSTTTYSSGPTIISSTQGVVSTPEDIVNPAQDVGGGAGIVPAFQYIDVTFDRPVDPSSFVPGDVDIQYRDINTPGSQPPTSDISNLVTEIVPLNQQFWGSALSEAATEYRIVLSAPQTAVGTYSYFISPSVNDGYLYYGLSGTTVTDLTASSLDPTQANLVVPALGINSKTASSNIVVPNAAPGVNQTITDVKVNVQFSGANDVAFYQLLQEIGSEYSLALTDGNVSVKLASDQLGASQSPNATDLLPDLAGHGYVSTTFDDESTEPIADGNFQFSGVFHPTGNLQAFAGEVLTGGSTWTLIITSTNPNTGNVPTGLLRDWSIQFTTETLQTDDTQPATNGNTMDQNSDAIPGQPAGFTPGFQTTGDVWAMPTPSSANSYTSGSPDYFTAPFAAGTSAIVVPGPSLAQYVEYPSLGGAVSILSSGTFTSQITIGGPSYADITDLIVKLQLTYPKDNDLVITLISPAGTPITLAALPSVTNPSNANPFLTDANFGDSANFGSNTYRGPTVFTDDAVNSLNAVTSDAPYIGLYAPVTPLSNLNGQSLAGTWTLQIQNIGGSSTGTLDAWSITAATQLNPVNTSVNQVTIQFDRNMDPTTITPAAVLAVTGPLGPIAGPFSVTQVDARTYTIGFAAQTLAGTYTVALANTIKSADGTLLDSDQNAGVDMLNDTTGSKTYPVYSTTGGSLPPSYDVSNGVFTSTQSVQLADAGLIKNLVVTMNIDTHHGPASDLSAVLISPQGIAVQLFANLSSSTTFAGLTTTFQDASTVSINSASSGYAGKFNPQQPLSTLLDTNSAGTWTLVVKNVGANTYDLTGWSMTITTANPNSGVGATPADQATASFQLFSLGTTSDQSHEVWTPVGGAVNTGSNSAAGPVTAIATDPSDPSGNTVFIGAATGGVWKTTNFLTTNPSGPTYIPLIANAPTNGLNIGSIAVLGSQVDPSTISQSDPSGTLVDSMIFAATGNGNTNTLSPGIGILVSINDGVTWNLATGLTNTDSSGAWLSGSSGSRDNTFEGLIAYKIVVDPNLQANGNAIIYVAFTDPTGNGKGGIYRSVDSGKTWTLMRAGQATDIVLDPTSAVPSFINSNVGNPTNNVNAIDAAFAGDGIYRSPNRGVTWTELLGTNPDTNILDASTPNDIPVKVNNLPTPDGDFGRIVLATPAPTGNPIQDALYEGWLYAAVISQNNLNNPTGQLTGLYMTKDYGQTWTKVQVDGKTTNGVVFQNPTNNTTQNPYDVTDGRGIPEGDGNYAVAISVDPNNPNVVYLAGSAYTNYAAGMIRVDTTGISDAHAIYQGENAPDGGEIRADTTDVVALKNWYNTSDQKVGNYLTSITEPTINLLQNPAQPFSVNGSVQTNNIADVSNSGANITWIPFDEAFDYGNAATTQPVGTPSEYHQVLTEIDPITGLSRLIVATDQGVYSAVDDNGVFREYAVAQGVYDVAKSNANEQSPSGGVETWAGPYGQVVQTLNLNEPLSGSRNGNLQIAELYYGAVQPSQSAANAAGGLFYGEGQGIGLISSDPNILTDGNTTWKGTPVPSGGGGVATDQVGSGTVYNYANPFWSGTYTDFFQVNGVGRTNGLLTTSADGGDVSHDNEWASFTDSGNLNEGTFPANQSSNSTFSVNPINADQIVISSHPTGDNGAQIFATQDRGFHWTVIGTSTDLDNTYAPALAYGAPSTVVSEGNFIYAGTDGGNVFVTFTGGGNGTSNGNPWIKISNGLDGSAVEAIAADPNSGTHDAYAVTQNGVYYLADSTAANPTWVNITGNLTSITQTALGTTAFTDLAIKMLTSLAADWRYASPVLYVGANAGVYRGIDEAGTWQWASFPSMATDNAPADGGYLPNVEVSDLDLSIGNVDPGTGIPLSNATANNILMASTFGDGAYAIRVAPIVTLNAQGASSPGISGVAGSITTNGVTTYYANADDNTITINGASEKKIVENGTTYNQVTINVYDLTNDPNEMTPLGTATTNPDGTFTIQISRPSPDGLHDIVLVGTDQANVTGPAVSIQLQVETTRPVITSLGLTPATDTGASNSDGITNDTTPTVTGTGAVGAAVTISITDSSNNTTTFSPVTADSSGVFDFNFPTALAAGTYTVSAVETDLALNTSLPVSFTMQIVTSVSAPTAPQLAAASDSGVSSSDDLTNVTLPTFTGTALPNDVVTLMVNGAPDGTATADSSGNYSITVPNALGADGAYSITATQTDIAGNISSQSPALTVTLDTTAPTVAGQAVTAAQFGTFIGTVATITDLHPDGTATINWGDGQSSQGTLVATSSPTVFDIQGAHVYHSTGSFTITITAADAAGNPASASATASATVTVPVPAITPITLNVNEGQSLINVAVASFTNGAPSPNISDFSATINWGDGSATANATLVPDPNNAGSFLIEGSHTYADGGNPSTAYTITITVSAVGVSTPSVATGTANVANVPPTVTLGGIGTGFINQIISLPITATDPGASDTATGFTYTIDWGDGSAVQTIAATANNGTGAAPTHAYGTSGNYAITVTATDKDGGQGSATTSLQIAPAPTLSNVIINGGNAQRSHIDSISFTLTSATPITSVDTSDMTLVFDGSTIVPLTNATVNYDSASGQVTVNLTGVTLANGDYQLFVFPGTGVLPINFTKLTGDTNGDGLVTKTDLNTVKSDLGAAAGQPSYNPNADINGDGMVNSTDLSLIQVDNVKKKQIKVIKLTAGKVVKPPTLKFAKMSLNATRGLPIQLQLVNTDPSRPLTVSDVSLLGGGSNFSFVVINQTYGATSFTIPAGGTLVINVYFTPAAAGSFSTQLKAQFSNSTQSTYGAVIAKFNGKATAPKTGKSSKKK